MKLSTEAIKKCLRCQGNNLDALDELAALESNQIVVRCKDCKEYKKNEDEVLACHVHDGLQLLVNPNHYCGYGEPKK